MLPSREPAPVGDSCPARWPDRAAGFIPAFAGRKARVAADTSERPSRRSDTRRGLPAPTFGAESRPLTVRFRHSCAADRPANLVR
jgi:hypothetical protein